MFSRFWLILLLAAVAAPAIGSEGYYRQPTIFDSSIIFNAEGDLWRVPAEGGRAQRLTTHASEESHPAVSPDGKTLAFTANYEGSSEVYVMPLEGGRPERITFDAESSIVVGWTPDGRLMYSTTAYAGLPDEQLVVIDLKTKTRERIPLAQASSGVYSPDGKTLFFARPSFHNNNTKRYKGGTARHVWKFVAGEGEAVNLTADHPGEHHSPMYFGGRVYFVCDRDGTMNLWSMEPDGAGKRQETRHKGWDVLAPSQGPDAIVYQLGADIWRFFPKVGETSKVPVTLASDFDQLREKWVNDPMEYLTSVHLHPRGESVVLTARGRLFVAPVSQGRLVQATRKHNVRYRDGVFMPDGKQLLTLSDESGEIEFWTLPANGLTQPQQVTSDGQILRFTGKPSPDGARVAYTDKNDDLWVLDVKSKAQTKISTSREGVSGACWSPDSRWLAYSMSAINTYSQIHLYNVEDQTRAVITSDRVNSTSPCWDPKGDWLYFLSDRNLVSTVGSPWGARQPEPHFTNTMRIYQIALRSGLRSPFKASDELEQKASPGGAREPARTRPEDDTTKSDSTAKSDAAEGEEKSEEKKEETATADRRAPKPIKIDLEGIEKRLYQLPVAAGNYGELTVNRQAIFYMSRGGTGAGRSLMAMPIKNKDYEPKQLADNIVDYELSADGTKLLLQRRGEVFVIAAGTSAPRALTESRVDLRGWAFAMDVREDFRQLFIDAWRLERDYFYDANMHGLDWNAMRDKYLPLVDRVTTRLELSDLIGQLMGELSALHVSVRGGDLRAGADQVRMASLGARLARDPAAGGYRVEYIYQTDPDYPDQASPLARPDVDVKEGDVIVQVNGQDALSAPDIGALLRNQQRRQVLLSVRRGTSEPKQVIVEPTANERELRYDDWEYTRRLKVEELGAGKIGYVHLREMGAADISEWYRSFYPVWRREGLIIDVRHNRGGNVDSIILEKLLRKAWAFWQPRVGAPYWNMQYAFRGHLVVLCDEFTASDGEMFTEGFRRLGLGKVIGTRTWGGEIWLSANNLLTDRGHARAPQTGVYGPERKWLIEGHGVDPDIVVDNLPNATFNGYDAQLQAAVEHLKKRIQEEPVTVPLAPPYPNMAFDYSDKPVGTVGGGGEH